MNWTAPVDAYCERTGAAFWAEPVNALSNLAFFAAAFAAFLVWRRTNAARRREGRASDAAGLLLVALVAVIGTGSFLFHTVAETWASLADVVPIALFIHAYFALALYRLVGLGGPASALSTLAFFGASFPVGDLLAPLVGASASYVPALLALFGIGGWLAAKRHPQGTTVGAAGMVFLVSLTARTLDEPLCTIWPLGTHFLWHLLNAATLGLLLVAAVREDGRGARRRRINA